MGGLKLKQPTQPCLSYNYNINYCGYSKKGVDLGQQRIRKTWGYLTLVLQDYIQRRVCSLYFRKSSPNIPSTIFSSRGISFRSMKTKKPIGKTKLIIESIISGKPDKTSNIPRYIGFLDTWYRPTVTNFSGGLVGSTGVPRLLKTPAAIRTRSTPVTIIAKPGINPIIPKPNGTGYTQPNSAERISSANIINNGYLLNSLPNSGKTGWSA